MTTPVSKMLGPNSFALMKQQAQKIVMLTAYDYASGSAVANSNVDVILVGDSLGMVVLGYDSTLKVTMDDMVSHTAAVRRGAPGKFIIADLPYLTYHLSAEQTKTNAARLIVDGSANAVKLEGGSASRLEAIRQIVDIEIPVCAHLGLTPQSVCDLADTRCRAKAKSPMKRFSCKPPPSKKQAHLCWCWKASPNCWEKRSARHSQFPQ